MAGEMQHTFRWTALIGHRVRLQGQHPHAGEYGRVVTTARTGIAGEALLVRLEDCPHGTRDCYVFEGRHLRPVGEDE